MDGRDLTTDDRGTISPLSHALTIGITTVLVIGLTVGASGLLQDERESATREDLRTIGNRLAGELTHVDQLAQRGGSATIQSSQTERVAGNRYAVELHHGPVCDRTRSAVETCLRLSVDDADADVVEYVPVKNESAVSLDARTSGQFVLSADPAPGGSSGRAGVVVRDLSSRVGIGDDVTRSGEIIGGALGSQPPIADFDFTPTSPHEGETVRFDASSSLDPDGQIDAYRWDWDGDGVYDEQTGDPVIDHSFDPAGGYNVSLRVVDDDGTSSNLTRFIDVSGLVYNDDIDTGTDSNDVRFTVTNNFEADIEITHVLVDPTDDSIKAVDDRTRFEHEIELSGSGDSGHQEADGGFELYTDGRISDLDDSLTLGGGDTATVEIIGFRDEDGDAVDMNGEEVRFGLKYEIGDRTNSSRFTDVIGSPSLSNYRLVDTGGDLTLRFDATHTLDDIDVTYGGDESGTLDETDFTRSGTTYEATLPNTDSPGIYWAKLTTAESPSFTPSGQLPLNDTVTVTAPGGAYTWTTEADWDNIDDSTGVVHADIGDHDADRVELGYSPFDEGGSNLVGYWPLDDPSAATEVSGVGTDGVIGGNPTNANLGIGASSAYAFDGDDDHVRIPDYEELDVSDDGAVTVSAWVSLDALPSEQFKAIFQNSDTAYNLQLENGDASYTIYDGGHRDANEGIRTGWVHLVGVYDEDESEEIVLYENGDNRASDDASGVGSGDGVDAGIATNIDEGGRYLDGQVDELRVYDRALSAGEVEDLYETPKQGRLTTGWQSGDPINHRHLELQYDVDVDTGEVVYVWVVGKQTSSGKTRTSGPIRIDATDPSSGSRTVSGLNSLGNGDQFRLKVQFDSPTLHGSPTVDSLSLEDTS